MPPTPLLTYGEVAELAHVSESTARRLGRSGALEEVRVSAGAVRVRAASVRRLLERGYRTPSDREEATSIDHRHRPR